MMKKNLAKKNKKRIFTKKRVAAIIIGAIITVLLSNLVCKPIFLIYNTGLDMMRLFLSDSFEMLLILVVPILIPFFGAFLVFIVTPFLLIISMIIIWALFIVFCNYITSVEVINKKTLHDFLSNSKNRKKLKSNTNFKSTIQNDNKKNKLKMQLKLKSKNKDNEQERE